MVAALIWSSRWRTSFDSVRWPCRVIESISVGMSAFSRFPQIRSPASHSVISAVRTSSS